MDKKPKRLKLSDEIQEQNDTSLNINHFPEEILEKIFSYLDIRGLCLAREVCKLWHAKLKKKGFWRKVDVDFVSREPNQMIKTIRTFTNMPLLHHTTHLKLTFENYHHCFLDVAKMFQKLRQRCPDLRALIFHRASLKVLDYRSVLNAAAKLLPEIRVLAFHDSKLMKGKWLENDDYSNIKVLNISNCLQSNEEECTLYSDTMPSLKKLHLAYENNICLAHPKTISELELLDLEYSMACQSHFLALQYFGFNLTELYMCFSDIEDENILKFDGTRDGLKYLKIICLRGCQVTFVGINSLIQTCQFLQHVYVGGFSSDLYPIDYSMCDPVKVKAIYSSEKCKHYSNIDYMQE